MKFQFLSVTALLISFAVTAADPTGEPNFLHPVIKDHGGIIELPDAASTEETLESADRYHFR